MSRPRSNSGGVVLHRKKVAPCTPPTGMGSLQQEMQHDMDSCFSDDQYSDAGYPLLPRPKAVLSLTRASLPWTSKQAKQASLLKTVPVRVKKKNCRTDSLPCDVSATFSPKVNSTHSGVLLTKQTSRRKSLSGIAELFFRESNHKAAANYSKIYSVEKPTVETEVATVSAKMSNRGRIHSRRGKGSTSGSEGQTNTKSKTFLKPARSLTFNFGSTSERKRRTLGFLGKSQKNLLQDTTAIKPSSPILLSRKAVTLPVSSRTSEFATESENQGAVKGFFSGSARTLSFQDITAIKSPSCRKKPHALTLNSLSYSVGQLVRGEGSPISQYSPALTCLSGMSSRQHSSESFTTQSEACLSQSAVSSPSSRTQSPKISRSPGTAMTSRGRKLSDPMLSTPDISEIPKPSPQGSTIKKRNTFCVRPSRLNPGPGWVRVIP